MEDVTGFIKVQKKEETGKNDSKRSAVWSENFGKDSFSTNHYRFKEEVIGLRKIPLNGSSKRITVNP